MKSTPGVSNALLVAPVHGDGTASLNGAGVVAVVFRFVIPALRAVVVPFALSPT